VADFQLAKRGDVDDKLKWLHYDHEKQIFHMVHLMTIITYFPVLLIILSQVIDISFLRLLIAGL
jgi:hypothetical protein